MTSRQHQPQKGWRFALMPPWASRQIGRSRSIHTVHRCPQGKAVGNSTTRLRHLHDTAARLSNTYTLSTCSETNITSMCTSNLDLTRVCIVQTPTSSGAREEECKRQTRHCVDVLCRTSCYSKQRLISQVSKQPQNWSLQLLSSQWANPLFGNKRAPPRHSSRARSKRVEHLVTASGLN